MREPDATEPGTPPREIVFALVPEYSHIAFSSALEPLRMANRMSGKTLYRWRIVSADGSAVASSGNLLVQVDGTLETVETAGLVLVCAGEHVQRHCGRVWLAWLRRLAQRRTPPGARSAPARTCWPARVCWAGTGARYTGRTSRGLREEFPNATVTSELFEIDRDRYTCSGGIAPLDMMLNLIRVQHGDALSVAISEEFICERIRGRNDVQRIPLRHHLGTSQPKLVEAIALMEANLDEPMRLDELARHVGLSRRQLERLFQKHLRCVPTRYYLRLRLSRARQLLLQTTMSIVDVAFACGFVSARPTSASATATSTVVLRGRRESRAVVRWRFPRTP